MIQSYAAVCASVQFNRLAQNEVIIQGRLPDTGHFVKTATPSPAKIAVKRQLDNSGNLMDVSVLNAESPIHISNQFDNSRGRASHRGYLSHKRGNFFAMERNTRLRQEAQQLVAADTSRASLSHAGCNRSNMHWWHGKCYSVVMFCAEESCNRHAFVRHSLCN